MTTTDPDRLIRRLWRLRERLSSPVSSIPYEVSGSSWATLCGQCQHPGHFTADAGLERCSRCGAEWVIVDGRVPKSSKHRAPGNRMEATYAELPVCASILARVPRSEE